MQVQQLKVHEVRVCCQDGSCQHCRTLTTYSPKGKKKKQPEFTSVTKDKKIQTDGSQQ